MAHIITGNDEAFADWAAKRIAHIGERENFGECRAVGIYTGNKMSDRLMAVVVFHGYHPQYELCQMSLASADPRWASRATVRGFLSIPFLRWGCNKVWLTAPHTSDRVLRLAMAFGFVKEATLRDHFGRGAHAVICRMLARDYDRKYLSQFKQAA